jgi:hypothetical protein
MRVVTSSREPWICLGGERLIDLEPSIRIAARELLIFAFRRDIDAGLYQDAALGRVATPATVWQPPAALDTTTAPRCGVVPHTTPHLRRRSRIGRLLW